MALFGEIIGVDYSEKIDSKSFASEKVDEETRVVGSRTTAPIGEKIERVKKTELGNVRFNDPIVFNAINKGVQTIMGAGRELRYDGEDKTTALNYFKVFLETIGEIGSEETEEELLNSNFDNLMTYGENFIELHIDESTNSPVDLSTRNPERMDFARDSEQKIVFGSDGNPIGYTQQLPYGMSNRDYGDEAPENVDLGDNKIFIQKDKIIHLTLYKRGDGYESYGLIEPGYDDAIYKKNIQKAQANAIYQRGFNIVIDKVGSAERFPTPAMINHATSKLKMMENNRYFAFPYWHDINTLKFDISEGVSDFITDLKLNQCSALGMPLSFASGEGGAANKHTLSNQQQFLEYSLQDVVERTIAGFKKFIFKRIAKAKKFESVPYYVWGDIGTENVNDKANRLTNYANNKVGILPPALALRYVLKSENIEVPEEELKKYLIQQEKSQEETKETKEKKSPDKKDKKDKSFGSKKYSFSDIKHIVDNLK